jgi:hypothetical protein
MSVRLNQDNIEDSIKSRRSKVLELLVKGYDHDEIADTLQIPWSTISGDIQYIRQQAQESLHEHIQERLLEEYQSCLTGINRILKLTLDIAENLTTTDDKTKLQALTLANECYKAKLDLTTNSVVVTDTISMLKNKLDHLNAFKNEPSQDLQDNRLKKDCEESQNQQQTASGIF